MKKKAASPPSPRIASSVPTTTGERSAPTWVTLIEPLERACRVCGCTQNRACLGGCWWIDIDLCSACVR